jgi:hypothetical protein
VTNKAYPSGKHGGYAATFSIAQGKEYKMGRKGRMVLFPIGCVMITEKKVKSRLLYLKKVQLFQADTNLS